MSLSPRAPATAVRSKSLWWPRARGSVRDNDTDVLDPAKEAKLEALLRTPSALYYTPRKIAALNREEGIAA